MTHVLPPGRSDKRGELGAKGLLPRSVLCCRQARMLTKLQRACEPALGLRGYRWLEEEEKLRCHKVIVTVGKEAERFLGPSEVTRWRQQPSRSRSRCEPAGQGRLTEHRNPNCCCEQGPAPRSRCFLRERGEWALRNAQDPGARNVPRSTEDREAHRTHFFPEKYINWRGNAPLVQSCATGRGQVNMSHR